MHSRRCSINVDMVNKCCVPGCRGNYASGPRVAVFQFPQDEDLRKAWLHAISRPGFVPSKHSTVCELHFTDDDIVREIYGVDVATGNEVTVPRKPRIRPHAIPSRFCSSHVLSAQKEADTIRSIQGLADYVKSQQRSAFWHMVEGSERLLFMHIAEDAAPWIKYSIVVKANLTLTFHVVKTPVLRLGPDLRIPTVAKSKVAMVELLESIEKWDGDPSSGSESLDKDICNTIRLLLGKLSAKATKDKAHVIEFLGEQFEQLSANKRHKGYSVDLMVFSCLLFTISPHAYKYIRSSGSVILPHPIIIRSTCSSFGSNLQPEHHSTTFLGYVAKRISDLEDQHRFVVLLVDEIHIEPYFEYKGGTTGATLNSAEAANSVLVFTVQSLTCQFKEVAHMVPVQKASTQYLHKLLRDVIRGLEKSGYRVACIVSGDTSVNRKAVSHFTSPPTSGFVYPHPSDPARPLFFVIDPVHILKSIRNDWLDQKNDLLGFFFPEFKPGPTQAQELLCASFATVREAYNLECDDQMRYLNVPREALYPSNVERHDLTLTLEIFNCTLPKALRSLGVMYDVKFLKGTMAFIEIVVKWWRIVSMVVPGKTRKDQHQNPASSSEDDPNVDFLYKLLDWLDEWKSKDLDSGMLSKDTHTALQQTTHAFVEVLSYCFTEVKLPYVLLGKIRTDSLDERFGTCRKLAGSQYHMSIRQLYEGEDEVLLQNTLPTIAAVCEADGDEQWEDLHKRDHLLFPDLDADVTGEALSKIRDVLPVLVYVAGHAVHATLKRLSCANCRPALTINKMINIPVEQQHCELVKELGGEGLLFPTMFAVNAVVYGYVVIEELSKQAEFLKVPNRHQFVTDFAVELLSNEERSDINVCDNGHTSELLLRHVLWCSTNILLKNFFCSMSVETVVSSARSRKRKAQ